MRGNKRTFPNFHICFLISMNSNSFQIQNPWAKMIWLLPFKLNEKGFLKTFEFHLEICQIQKLYATQCFSWEKIKWLLQIIWNMSWEFQRIKFKVFWIYFQFGLFEFYSNYFSPKIKYMEIRVTWFPIIENWRKINLKSFWYFLKWFLLDFSRAVALLDLFEFVGFYLILEKCPCCRKSFSKFFDILYAYIIFCVILFLLF